MKLLIKLLLKSGAFTPAFWLTIASPVNATIADDRGYSVVTGGVVPGLVISQSATPSRTSGVAPLYVNFDCNGTTSTLSTNAAHELYFATDFGDPSSGTWANGVQSSGLTSKNLGIGPVTGHVYETPGTYTVNTVITDGVNVETVTNTITVTDPNTVYAGTNTICISHSNNFTGAPSGASQINTAGNTDMYAAWNTYKASNKRILFCKADSWTSSAVVSLQGLTGTTLSGYGTGVAHTFASGTLASLTPSLTIANVFEGGGSTDCRICNFKIAAAAAHTAVATSAADSVALTYFKIEVRGATAGIESTTGGSGAGFYKQDQHCVYECLVDQVYGYAFIDPPLFNGATAAIGSPGIFTATGHAFNRYNKVQLSGTAPSGLSTGTTYYISGSNLTANTFSLSSTFPVDTPLAISGTGTCNVLGMTANGGIGAFVGMTRGGFMGSYLDACNKGEQTLRMPYLNTAHVNNNYIARPNQSKNVFKIHCRGYDEISSVTSGYSEKIVVTANVMDMRGGYSYGELIPGNGRTATATGTTDIVIGNGGVSPGGERVRNGVVEYNYTYGCRSQPMVLSFASINCPNMTVRNNIADFLLGSTSTVYNPAYLYPEARFVNVRTSTPDPTVGVRIYNNSLYSNMGSGNTGPFVWLNDAVTDQVIVKNNLSYQPYMGTYWADPLRFVYNPDGATNIVNSNNTANQNDNPTLVAIPPVALTDWRPNTGSYAINSGATVPVLRDFNNATRVGGTYDMGAVLP